jgi:hypothetical protein
MSRIRHEMKKSRKAKGGGVVYSGAGSNVVETAEKKRGGPAKEVDRPEGRKPKPRMDKRPRRALGKVSGPAADREMAQMEVESGRPFKSGGSVGADRASLSSATNARRHAEREMVAMEKEAPRKRSQ